MQPTKGKHQRDGRLSKNPDKIEIRYILFSDKETFLEILPQDSYDYRDYDSAAHTLNVSLDRAKWDDIFRRAPDARVDPFGCNY